MTAYDQTWIRNDEIGFRSASVTRPICESCGAAPRCQLPRPLNARCGAFLPVLGFQGRQGLDQPLWNTFRRGLGVFRRLPRGTRIRAFDKSIEEFVSDGVVVETHQGLLGDLLERHASFNHLMLNEPEPHKADARLLQVLVKLYGRNYATPDAVFSVVYVEGR